MEILYIIVQLLAVVGLVCGMLMFWTIKRPPKITESSIYPKVSIIIPARNEEFRLPPLLESLQNQQWKNFETIVVDDGSTDQTAKVALQYGAKVFQGEQVGNMSPGKSNACAFGARQASGEWLLFLDADVQLVNEDSLERIMASFHAQQGKGILSIQPYHRIIKPYENLSVIFNIIVMTGMNVFTFWKEKFSTAGSFGPCIVCDKESYIETGGHEAAEESIMDDFALSDLFLENGLPVTNYGGKGIINMRMYEEGVQQLFEGWTKNLATASQSTHPLVMTFIQVWIFGVILTVATPFIAAFTDSFIAYAVSIFVYLGYGVHVYVLARRVGNFHVILLFTYPIFVLFFTAVFIYSLFRTHVLHSVMWKGRKIKV